MNKPDGRGFRLGFAALALFTKLAGDFWRNLLSWYGFGAIVTFGTELHTKSISRGLSWRRAFATATPYPNGSSFDGFFDSGPYNYQYRFVLNRELPVPCEVGVL